MRRDYFSLEVRGTERVESADERPKPTLHVRFTGPEGALDDLLAAVGSDRDRDDPADVDIDVAFRLRSETAVEDRDAAGVLSLTDRMTGDYLLEVNADADDVVSVVHAARDYGKEVSDDSRYRIHVIADGDDLLVDEKSTLLVYDAGGELLRQHSLIPSGVEL